MITNERLESPPARRLNRNHLVALEISRQLTLQKFIGSGTLQQQGHDEPYRVIRWVLTHMWICVNVRPQDQSLARGRLAVSVDGDRHPQNHPAGDDYSEDRRVGNARL